MGKLPDNYREGLESELDGLQARLDAAGDDTSADTRAMLNRRIGEVHDQLGTKPKTKRERRPAGAAAETRPG